MDNVKNDKYYLEKIISDLGFIIEHTKGKTKDEIENNDLLVDSIMFRIIQIAENNSRRKSSKRNIAKFLGLQSRECVTK